ncbi:MAG: TerC family protein [Myxococcota bacterium]
MLELLSRPDAWIALVTLTALEIVLGIDNIVFIAIVSERLPANRRELAYRLGLGGAMFMRIGLLFAIGWVMGLTEPWFRVVGEEISGRDLILLGGGLFLIAKSTHEIHAKVEMHEPAGEKTPRRAAAGLAGVVAQIMALDMVFSLDSVITAVGMADEIAVMVAAVVIAVLVMLVFAPAIGRFVNRHPSMKILALAFLMLIGVLLVAEGFGKHIDKGYIYFAMGFSLLVELINIRARRARRAAGVQQGSA